MDNVGQNYSNGGTSGKPIFFKATFKSSQDAFHNFSLSLPVASLQQAVEGAFGPQSARYCPCSPTVSTRGHTQAHTVVAAPCGMDFLEKKVPKIRFKKLALEVKGENYYITHNN